MSLQVRPLYQSINATLRKCLELSRPQNDLRLTKVLTYGTLRIPGTNENTSTALTLCSVSLQPRQPDARSPWWSESTVDHILQSSDSSFAVSSINHAEASHVKWRQYYNHSISSFRFQRKLAKTCWGRVAGLRRSSESCDAAVRRHSCVICYRVPRSHTTTSPLLQRSTVACILNPACFNRNTKLFIHRLTCNDNRKRLD